VHSSLFDVRKLGPKLLSTIQKNFPHLKEIALLGFSGLWKSTPKDDKNNAWIDANIAMTIESQSVGGLQTTDPTLNCPEEAGYAWI